jgi:hypothetical protein
VYSNKKIIILYLFFHALFTDTFSIEIQSIWLQGDWKVGEDLKKKNSCGLIKVSCQHSPAGKPRRTALRTAVSWPRFEPCTSLQHYLQSKLFIYYLYHAALLVAQTYPKPTSEEHNCSHEHCGSRTPTSINTSAQHFNYTQMRRVLTTNMTDR